MTKQQDSRPPRPPPRSHPKCRHDPNGKREARNCRLCTPANFCTCCTPSRRKDICREKRTVAKRCTCCVPSKRKRDCKNNTENLCSHGNLKLRCSECKLLAMREKEEAARLESRECEWCMGEVMRWAESCSREEMERMAALGEKEEGVVVVVVEGVNVWKVRYAYLLKHGFVV